MRRKSIILIAIIALIGLMAIMAIAHYSDIAPMTTEISETPTPAVTATPTPTATPVPPRVVGGGFAINDSMDPPPRTPTPDMSKVNPAILSLETPETVMVGDIFTISVMVNPNGNEINGIQTSLQFNKDLVQVDSIEMSDKINESFSIPAIINNEQGTVENIFGMPPLPASFPKEEFIFAVISLTAKEPGNAELRLERNVATYASGADTPILLPTKTEVKNITIK